MASSLRIALGVCGLLMTACPQQQPAEEAAAPAAESAPAVAPDPAVVRAEVEAQLTKVNAALAGKDLAGFVDAFADDATWTVPNGATYRGRAEIEAGTKALFDSFETFTITSTTIDEFVAIGDREALTFSTLLYTQTVSGGAPESRRNPYADYWKKGDDGVWRIAREVNADGPAPAEVALAEAPANP